MTARPAPAVNEALSATLHPDNKPAGEAQGPGREAATARPVAEERQHTCASTLQQRANQVRERRDPPPHPRQCPHPTRANAVRLFLSLDHFVFSRKKMVEELVFFLELFLPGSRKNSHWGAEEEVYKLGQTKHNLLPKSRVV